MQKMTTNEAVWYGAECAVQDAMKGSAAWVRRWAKRNDFITEAAWLDFYNSYYLTYQQTREEMLNVETESNP